MKCSLCRKEGHRSNNKKFHPADNNTDVLEIEVARGINTTPVDRIHMSSTITREEAERSATEWCGPSPSPVRDWLVAAIMDPKQHRDIGKHLAMPSEIYVNKRLSEMCGRPILNITGESWDGITDDDKPKVRNQIKFRMDAWHFETTRRNSKKNIDTNSTGHVAYRKDEFDMVAIFKPGPAFGITGSTIRCIPVSALINPSKQDQLITTIPAAIRKIYDNEAKTVEVINTLYQIPL
jgi:hypothetical protein